MPDLTEMDEGPVSGDDLVAEVVNLYPEAVDYFIKECQRVTFQPLKWYHRRYRVS